MNEERIRDIVREEIKLDKDRKQWNENFVSLQALKLDAINDKKFFEQHGYHNMYCRTTYDEIDKINKLMSICIKRGKELGVYPY